MTVYSTSNVAAILNAECGEAATLALVEACGGQRIAIPKCSGGRLVKIPGADILLVLVRSCGGTDLDIPSRGHAAPMMASARLRADVTRPVLSANEIANKHGVTSSCIHKLRGQMRGETANAPNLRHGCHRFDGERDGQRLQYPFNKAAQGAPVYRNKIAMDVKSTGSDETYGGIAGVPQRRE